MFGHVLLSGMISTVRRLALGLAVGFGLIGAAAAAGVALHPSLTSADVSAPTPEGYFELLLKWTKDVPIGPVTARVTYLDPPLYAAWMKQSAANLTQADFDKQFTGFPQILRFRVGYRAAERPMIHAKEWKVALVGDDGAHYAAPEGHRIAPMDLKPGPSGDVWEDDWDYQVAVPAGFLTDARKSLALDLHGPAGDGSATWTFGAVTQSTDKPDAYVPYLGGALAFICLIVLAATFLTRPPKPRLT